MALYDSVLDGPGDEAEEGESSWREPRRLEGGGRRKPASVKPAIGKYSLRGFVPAERPPPREAWYEPPRVPREFDERHVFPPPPPPPSAARCATRWRRATCPSGARCSRLAASCLRQPGRRRSLVASRC
mmetsp:Transcript_603/g.1879  ORF Transcript_603/g.1879 Transcript_603/m.1879 type:complete len:129 (-) Transcript_603:981-1367(-)